MKRSKKRPVGRPKIPDKKMPVSVRLSPTVARYLRTSASPADVVQSAIERTQGYMDYIQLLGAKCQND